MKKTYKNIMYINAVCASRTVKLVGSDRIARMEEAENLKDAFDILRESSFGGSEKAFSSDKFGEIIKAENQEIVNFVKEYAPNEKIMKFCLIDKDFYNAEAIVKSFFMGISPDKFIQEEGIFTINEIKDAVENGNFSNMPKELSDAITDGKKVLEDGKGGMAVGGIFVNKKYQCLLKIAPYGYLKKIVQREIDGLNISVCLRAKNKELAKKMIILGGTLKENHFNALLSMNRLDILAEFTFTKYKQLVLDTLTDAENGRPFTKLENYCFSQGAERMIDKRFVESEGSKPFMLYYMRRKNQMLAVQTILTGKANNLPKDQIVKRVVTA